MCRAGTPDTPRVPAFPWCGEVRPLAADGIAASRLGRTHRCDSVFDDLNDVASRRRVRNSGGLIFVDESAEQIAAAKVVRRCQRRRVAPVRWEESQRAVWSVLVVMAPVGAEHVFEMAAAEDE